MSHVSRFLCLCVLTVLAGCTTPLHQPKLEEIYGDAARANAFDRDPVVVIPGVLGSRLAGPRGEQVWGAFGGGSVSPKTPDGARLLALPMRAGAPLASLVDEVRTDGALDRVRIRLFGLPFQQRAYADILGLLGAGGYRDPALLDAYENAPAVGLDGGSSGELNWGQEHFTCFQFAYDWRRDNAENAAKLHAFLLEKRAEVQAERARRYGGEPDDHPVRFDLIAHSMGGLVARHMLRYGDGSTAHDPHAEVPWSGAPLVKKLVMIGTPNAGSAEVLHNLTGGAVFGPFLPKYSPQILGTMPALYQLIPRARHGTLVGPNQEALDPLSPELWEAAGWGLADPEADEDLQELLPDVADPAERRRIALDHVRKSLERASEFFDAMDRPSRPPAGTEIFLVAGDAVPTSTTLEVDRDGTLTTERWTPGDNTVTRASALLDERPAFGAPGWTSRLQSPIAFEGVTFLHTDHIGLTRDPGFSDNVLWLLLERPEPGDASHAGS